MQEVILKTILSKIKKCHFQKPQIAKKPKKIKFWDLKVHIWGPRNVPGHDAHCAQWVESRATGPKKSTKVR
jgi:hypothetical protein